MFGAGVQCGVFREELFRERGEERYPCENMARLKLAIDRA